MTETSPQSTENSASLVTPGRRVLEGVGADIILIKDVRKYENTDFTLVAHLDGIGAVELPPQASSYQALTELTGKDITADTEPIELIREVVKLNPQFMGFDRLSPHAALVFGYAIDIPEEVSTGDVTVTARLVENDEIVQKQYGGFAVRASMNAIVYPSVNNLLPPENVPTEGSATIPGWYIFSDELTPEGKFYASIIVGDPDMEMSYTELLSNLEITETIAEDAEGADELNALTHNERALNAGRAAYAQGLYRFEANGLMLAVPLSGGEAFFHDEGNHTYWIPISILPVNA